MWASYWVAQACQPNWLCLLLCITVSPVCVSQQRCTFQVYHGLSHPWHRDLTQRWHEKQGEKKNKRFFKKIQIKKLGQTFNWKPTSEKAPPWNVDLVYLSAKPRSQRLSQPPSLPVLRLLFRFLPLKSLSVHHLRKCMENGKKNLGRFPILEKFPSLQTFWCWKLQLWASSRTSSRASSWRASSWSESWKPM